MTKARTEIMRRILAMIAVVLGIVLTGFAETVTNVRGSQRPNSNLVDIYYDLNAVDGWSYTVEVAAEGRTNEVTATTFSGDVGKGITPGKNRHILWEAGADWRDKKGDVKAVVIATVEAKKGKPKKVQLWAGGPYWADRNIGADNPWDYGLYFWWGDTTGHSPSTDGTFCFNFWLDNPEIYTGYYDYTCYPYRLGKSVSELQSAGWLTSDGVLAPKHDAAHVKWGGAWRMPTIQEIADISNKCDCVSAQLNGVNGYIVRGRGKYASNSIFFPCAGYGGENGVWWYAGGIGLYWSSVPSNGNHSSYELYFYNGNTLLYNSYRCYGRSVRPVQGTRQIVNGASALISPDH